MTISLLLVLWTVYAVALWRWTRMLPTRIRRLVRSFFVVLLLPYPLLQEGRDDFSPGILRLVSDVGSVRLEAVSGNLLQVLCVSVSVFLVWSGFAFLCSAHSTCPRTLHRLKWAGVIFAVPSWTFLPAYLYFVAANGGAGWSSPMFLVMLTVFGLVCTLAAMAMLLIAMDCQAISPGDVFFFLWASFPLVSVVAMISLWLLGFRDCPWD